MTLGVHCSIREGYVAALQEARRLGLAAMQMFGLRRHHEPSDPEFDDFRRARTDSEAPRILVHVRYVPCLASSDSSRGAHSSQLLAREIRLASRLGAEGLVLHAGAFSPEESGCSPATADELSSAIRRGHALFSRAVGRAFDMAGMKVRILIENVPGGGRRMGASLEELAEMGNGLARMGIAVGFCLDTAHAWAQGYDIASAEGMWRFLALAHKRLDSRNIAAFHLNDTRALLGSHREHHWHWGQGYLGTEGLKLLLSREEFRDVPGILETPKDAGMDEGNLRLLRGLQSKF